MACNVQFLRVSMRNFMSYGNREQEFVIEPNTTTLIVGENRDVGGSGTSRNGVGKCHGVDTPILMADGSIKMVQDVVVGDKLMGDDGSPRNVLSLATGEEELFLVKQNKGMDYVVNKSHILSLKCGTTRPRHGLNKGDIVNIPLEKYLEFPNAVKKSVCGYIADLHQFGTNDVFEPWFIGLWLADGTSAKPEISINKNDTEILDSFYSTVDRNGWGTRIAPSADRENCQIIYVNGGFERTLRSLGVHGNKHIPLEYKNSTYENRIELLSGIIDGDGYLHNNMYELTLKDTQLVDDIVFIARSVGFRVIVRDKFSKCQNFDGDIYKRITISGDIEKLTCRLKRKSGNRRKKTVNVGVTGIKVRSIGHGRYYGFEIDGNHLYCLGDMTVTHNTSIFNAISFALFGVGCDPELKADHYVNFFNKKQCSVSLEFLINDQIYRITRTRKPAALKLEAINEVGEVVENLTNDAMTNTQNMIESIIGMDREIFMMVFYLTPNRYAFMAEKPARQRDLIEKILNLNALTDRANILKNVVRKDLQADLRVAEELLDNGKRVVDQERQRFSDLTERRDAWNVNQKQQIDATSTQLSQIALDDGLVNTYIELLSNRDFYADKLAAAHIDVDSLTPLRDSTKMKIESIEREQMRVNELRVRLDGVQSNMAKKNAQLKEVGDVASTFERKRELDQRLQSLMSEMKQTENNLTVYNNRLNEHHKTISELETQLDQVNGELAQMPTPDAIQVERDIIARNKVRQENITKNTNELNKINNTQHLYSMIDETKKQRIELQSGTCPTCKQPHFSQDLVDEKLAKEEQLEGQLRELHQKVSDLNDEIEKIKSTIEDAIDETQLSQIEQTVIRLQQQKDSLLRQRERINTTELENQITLTNNTKGELGKEIQAVEGEINNLPVPKITVDEFYLLKSELSSLNDQWTQLERDISNVQFTGDLDGLRDELVRIESRIDELTQQTQKRKIAFDANEESLNQHKYSSRFKSVNDLDREKYNIDQMKTQIEKLESEPNPYQEMVDTFVHTDVSEQQKRVSYLTKKLEHCGYLIRLLTSSDSFIRKSIISKYVGFLNKRINDYKNRLGLPHVIQVNSDLTVEIYKISEEVSFYNMSAGERLRLNTATSAAFKDLLKTLGVGINLTMVDELMDGSLDPDGMNKAFELLKDTSDSLMVISHRTEFNDRVDSVLTVVKEAEFSRLELR